MESAVEYCTRQGWFDENQKLTSAGEEALERIMASEKKFCARCQQHKFIWTDEDYICVDCRYGA